MIASRESCLCDLSFKVSVNDPDQLDSICQRLDGNGNGDGNVLFNDALNTFYLRLYGVKDYSDSERRNPLPSHCLLFPFSSKGSFICIIPHTG